MTRGVDCVARGTGGEGATAYCHGDDLSVHNHLLSLTLCAAMLISLARLPRTQSSTFRAFKFFKEQIFCLFFTGAAVETKAVLEEENYRKC